MTILRRLLSFTAAAAAMAVGANATLITYNLGTTPATTAILDQRTNYTSSISIPQFNLANPSICPVGDSCVLNSIFLTLTGDVLGDAKFESLDAAPATVVTNLEAQITLLRPDNSSITVVLPLVSNSDNVTAFDGNLDFGGLSGITRTGLAASLANSATLMSPTDIALFSGAGTLSLPVTAAGASNGSGAGNLITQFATKAGASVAVTYDYTDTPPPTSTPEPATYTLFGSALLGLGFLRKRA